MFNTMTITKAAGALIGSMLVLMFLSWGASALYQVGPGEEAAAPGEEPEPAPQAYSIAVEETGGGAGDAPAEVVDINALIAAGDAAAGEKVFGKCKTCHSVEGKDGTGPHLNGVVGRAVASVPGYAYDDAMKEHVAVAPTWTPEALQEFLLNPKKAVPGTKMSFVGLPKAEDRANVILYLSQIPG